MAHKNKKYGNVAEVRAGEFPKEEHCYRMIPGEEEKFLAG